MNRPVEVNVGKRGEIVIPKRIRETLGITPGGTVNVIESTRSISIIPTDDDIVRKARERARKLSIDVKKLRVGNRLYEELF
jgi:AbrB family looped-hinge helix DNA binding protein